MNTNVETKNEVLVSFIVPHYNEHDCLTNEKTRTMDRLIKSADELGYPWEIVAVNDGSKDDTLQILCGYAAKYTEDGRKVKVVSFSRNFGHQAAVTAGLKHIDEKSKVCVIIDADMQDPPEIVGEMLEVWATGKKVVYGKRVSRDGESAFKLFTANAFYRILNKLAYVEIPKDVGDFRVVDREVVDHLNNMPEQHKFLRGLWPWLGFEQVAFEYERQERGAGVTHYPMKKMVKLALDGLFSLSEAPVTMIAAMTAFLFVMAVVFFFIGIIAGRDIWFILGAVNFVGGILNISNFNNGKINMMTLDNSRGRPQYVVEKTINM